MFDWQLGFIDLIRTISEITTAGIAITAFSLLLYSLTYNLRNQVAKTFSLIMMCVVIVFSAEAIGSIAKTPETLALWLRVEWVGIILLPPTYLHFSDALVATTGRPSRWRRKWAVRLTYLFSVLLLATLPFNILVGPLVIGEAHTTHLERTLFTELFTLYYLGIMVLAWINFVRAYIRTVTPASRRRMGYLVIGALAPAIGSFPFLLYGSRFITTSPGWFWIIAFVMNAIVAFLLILMAYAVSFFGVSWSDRVVKIRLLKWLLRGPFTAGLTLALTTLTSRTGIVFGWDLGGLVPIVMALTIIVMQLGVTLFSPLMEKWLFYGNDQQDLEMLRTLEDRLLTRTDLLEFLEMILSAVIDLLQAKGAFLAALSEEGIEMVITSGRHRFNNEKVSDDLTKIVIENGHMTELLKWGDDLLFPLYEEVDLLGNGSGKPSLLGFLGVTGGDDFELDESQKQTIKLLTKRAAMAIEDRKLQLQIFDSMERLTRRVDYIQRLRAKGRYDSEGVMAMDDLPENHDLAVWVKNALTHYWGGPKLTENPLMKFQVVKNTAEDMEGNQANALRSILKEAILFIRPEGEKRFTAEWILYNILEMKFLEGRKVREIAVKLSMSEADLYRKQRIAIEAVADAVINMEREARSQSGEEAAL